MIVLLYCALFLGVACYNNNKDNFNSNYHQDNDCAIRSDFECNNGTCISQIRICDGFKDCGRGEDEDRNNCEGNSHSYNYADNLNRYSDNDRYSNRRYGGSDSFNRYSDNDHYSDRRYKGSDSFNRYSDDDRYSDRRYKGSDSFNRYSDDDRYSDRRYKGSDIFNRYSNNYRYSNRRYGADNSKRFSDNDRYTNNRFGRRDLRRSGSSLDTEVGLNLKSGRRRRNCSFLEITANVDGCDDN